MRPGILLLILMASCATNQEDYLAAQNVSLSAGNKKPAELPTTTKSDKVSGNKGDYTWTHCQPVDGSSADVILVISRFRPNKPSCQSELIQPIIRAKKQAFLITPEPGLNSDLGGDSTVSSVLNLVRGTFPNGLSGIWGIDTASILAGRLAKQLQPNWLVLGEGHYDLEATLTEGPGDLIEHIDRISVEEGEPGIERRSMAWDPEGLPKKVYLYYGKSSPDYLKKQADEFKAVLSVAQFTVDLGVYSYDSASFSLPAHGSAMGYILKKIN